MLENGERILQSIRAIQASQEIDQIVNVLINFAEQFGFESIFLGQLVNPLKANPDDILYYSTWPMELEQSRLDNYSILHDPVALCALQSTRPFRWCEAYKRASKMGLKVVQNARDFGLLDGYMFPVHSLDNLSGGVSLGGETIDISALELLELELVVQTMYLHLENILGPFPYQEVAQISQREIEVAHFVAAGKTNWEIATILGIQEDTVKKTIKRASDKVNAVNRTHLVSNLMSRGRLLS